MGHSRSRPVLDSPGMAIAHLDGSAGYAVGNAMPLEEAVEHIRASTTRLDLLHEAAGVCLGAWEADPVSYRSGWMKADLLVAAGADPELMEPYRLETCARLSRPFVCRHPQ